MSKSEKDTAVAETTESKGLSLFGDKSQVPAHLQTESAMGNENVTAADLKLPRLSLLQALSPELRTVEGAKPGLLFNTVTKELYESVNLINLFFKKEFAVFKLRKLGGGLLGNFDTAGDAQEAINAQTRPEDYEVVETDKHYCLLLDEEGNVDSPIAIYMNSTKLGVSKAWNSEIQLIGKNVDRFATAWNVSSETQQNRRNEAYENFTVAFAGWVSPELYAAAKDAYLGFAGAAPQKAAA